jgi:hypothetical protein
MVGWEISRIMGGRPVVVVVGGGCRCPIRREPRPQRVSQA